MKSRDCLNNIENVREELDKLTASIKGRNKKPLHLFKINQQLEQMKQSNLDD